MIKKIAVEYAYSTKTFLFKFKAFHNVMILFSDITFVFINFLVTEISN